MIDAFRESLRRAWQQRRFLFAIAFVHRVLGVVLLWPLFGLVTSWWLATSGNTAVTDEAIVAFLLTPIGLIGGLVCASLGIGIAALELSSMILLAFAAQHGYRVSIPVAVRVSFLQMRDALGLILRVILRAALILGPCLAAAALIGWLLLTDYDINYYLAERPPRFQIAIAIAGILLAGGILVTVRNLASWTLSLPLLLTHYLSPRRAIEQGRRLVGSQRGPVALTWLIWLVFHLMLSMGDVSQLDCDFLAVNKKLATRSLIQRSQTKGRPVYVWTIDHPTAMLYYLSRGADGLITNDPAAGRRAIEYFRSLNLTERLLLDAAIRLGVVPFQVPSAAGDATP